MNLKQNVWFLLIGISLVSACRQNRIKNETDGEQHEVYYKPAFSERFIIENDGDDKRLIVHNPWQGSQNVKFTYTLTNKNNDAVRTVKIPVERVICLSSTHVAFIDFIDKVDKIVGVSGAGYISNENLRQRIANSQTVDVGYENYLSYEVIASLKPDVIFAYGVDGELGKTEAKLNEMGIKLVYIGEYLEETPLAKTEWLVAVAAFFNEEEKAIEKLKTIEKEYNQLKALAENVSNKPKVLINAPYRDVWYLPSAKSTAINLLKDAGGEYIFERETQNSRESNPTNIEYVYTKALDADVWINQNSETSLRQLQSLDRRLTNISAFRNGNVYNNNKRLNPHGGNDFWESGIVNPQIILKDLLKIFHPYLLPEHQLFYYQKLE
ncbi:MAG: ABC transporter substrate-binding protein [Prevotellaceae bacterium]|jgi:iron complex transport system substrate-binding protein|nr:ABC transporter substrate-binding protein [Prevotellaceae bacterium]